MRSEGRRELEGVGCVGVVGWQHGPCGRMEGLWLLFSDREQLECFQYMS